ncbi:hypothetical protein NPIL_117581 [Nephila pilipes]|uniref:Uncharacterized protein n=1 Tax=Nephila pilipes TaxID=299642 RepID=A0A8X6NTP3_NEPPI|nr:hypothetical protein NPIL_117581 [Nephila pilipes]
MDELLAGRGAHAQTFLRALSVSPLPISQLSSCLRVPSSEQTETERDRTASFLSYLPHCRSSHHVKPRWGVQQAISPLHRLGL